MSEKRINVECFVLNRVLQLLLSVCQYILLIIIACFALLHFCTMLLLRFALKEIYRDRKKFAKAVFEVASSDLINMGISVVSYTLKDLKDSEV